ncbi:MAG: DUF4097 family beta strand repeat-containing protein [Microbacteriaceae bacterium]
MAQEKWLVDSHKIIDIGIIRSLTVSVIAGNVDIIGHDEPTARVEVHSVSGKPLKISLNGDNLEIDHPQMSWDNFIDVFRSFDGTASADVSIVVPRNVTIKFGAVSADTLISGLHTSGSINTIKGDVTIDGLSGDISLNGVTGEIAVRNHTGAITARTINGDITATGAITTFTGDTVSGDVFLDIDDVADNLRVNTVSGSVTARLAPGVAARYTLNNVGGTLRIDDSELRGAHTNYTSSFGALDTRWTEVKANTVSGNISIMHAVAS